ncbi:MAG: precorrin-2 C(20)-methyltransferase [Sporomusaceae bacterium]|nr:precorrin-2 C(20)-methyltransferase [Sporomusaceae bacterium]
MSQAKCGKLFGIGVGPGDPDLLTVKAVKLLQQTDVVCIPRSRAGSDSAAMKAARPYVSAAAEILEVSTPMIRDAAALDAEWRRGAEQIADRLLAGKNVAFITIGDSMLFSTYTYLMKKVRELIPAVAVESVSGITSFSAAAAHLNASLAEGGEQLAIIPAIDDPQSLKTVFAQFDNAVLMKVAGKYDQIVDVLTELGLKDKAVYISKLGYPEQLVSYDLDSLRGSKLEYLSLILVKRNGF